jgi:PEP-CTERM motif
MMKIKHAIPPMLPRSCATYQKPSLLLAALATALVLCPVKSQAASYTLDLTGTIAFGTFNSFDGPTTHFDSWMLVLGGLDPMNAITVEMGDVITLNVMLDGDFTVPASVDRTFFYAQFRGPSFPSGPNEVSGNFTFLNGGVDVLTSLPVLSSGAEGTFLSATTSFNPPANTAFTFDELTTTFTIDVLSGPAVLDFANLGYQLDSPVPEPSAAILLGLGGLSFIGLRRRRA